MVTLWSLNTSGSFFGVALYLLFPLPGTIFLDLSHGWLLLKISAYMQCHMRRGTVFGAVCKSGVARPGCCDKGIVSDDEDNFSGDDFGDTEENEGASGRWILCSSP
jgi:hypothetical protein